MNQPSVELKGEAAQNLLLDILDHLADRPIKTAIAFRNAMMGGGFVTGNPLIGLFNHPTDEFEQVVVHMQQAIREGRMIDFGFIPNSIIKSESLRSRDMFEANELLHPYDEPWLGISRWEGGCNGYFVVPKHFNNECLVIELYGVTAERGDIIMVYDAVGIRPSPGHTMLQPVPMRYRAEASEAELQDSDEKRASNSLDPLVTMLRFLADASIQVSRFHAPAKLNRARAKSGKIPIPDHSIVHTADYVAQIAAHRSRLTQGDGTGRHASPTAHWRRAHFRHLSGERVVKVRSSKVNWREAEELHRLFSKVSHKEEQT